MPKFPPRPPEAGKAPALLVSALPEELPWKPRADSAGEPAGPVGPVAPDLRAAPVAPAPADPAPPAGSTGSTDPVEPVAPAGGGKPRLLLFAAAGVVALLVAALAWWLLSPGSRDPAPPDPAGAGGYLFQRMGETVDPVRDGDCATHAYGQVKRFLAETRCEQLSRALYLSATEDGRTVHTSVAVVRMSSAEDARRLELLVKQDRTGNVNDLLREGLVRVPGLDRLSLGGFAATAAGATVVITESDAVDRLPDAAAHKAEMRLVSQDALRLGADLG